MRSKKCPVTSCGHESRRSEHARGPEGVARRDAPLDGRATHSQVVDHRPYPKIPARHDGSAPAPGGVWVATEKVHGAQLVVGTDGQSVRIGKRKAWLNDGEPFFGWQLLRADLEAAARAVHRSVGARGVVRLYGELFGGGYPHPSVTPLPGASPVQTGIWYAPDIRFVLFDVVVEPGEGALDEFLSHAEVESVGAAHGLMVVPLLGRGPRGSLEQLPVRFATHVPARLGLPPLADNMAEGVVLKPDARASVATRFVIKRKIQEFDEARFDESMPWNPDATLDLASLQTLASPLVNVPRLDSARSKVGTVAANVLDEIVLDVLVDLEGAFPAAFRALTPNDEASLRAHVARLAALLLAAT
jgi:Rnl2 family RNA ligase